MKILITISLALLVTGCCLSTCGPPIGEIEIALVNSDTRNDLFLNGILDSESIVVLNDNGSQAEFLYNHVDSISRGVITIFVKEASPNFRVLVDSINSKNNNSLIVNMTVGSTETGNKCCKQLETYITLVENYQFEVNRQNNHLDDILID